MRIKVTHIWQPAFILGFIILMTLWPSCANTTTGPSGGPKDTIPPVLKLSRPEYNQTGHPCDPRHSQVILDFNEYVQLKDASTNIFLSPPQKKAPKAKIKGKSVIITFDEPLDSNTTYSLSLGEAIKDNNEGNPFPPYVLSFSTGDRVDDYFVAGSITDAQTMKPQKGITVLFHTDPSDSSLFKHRPAAAAKTDAWGYFTVRNLSPDSTYRVYAINDLNNNNIYDPESETVGFVDSLFRPTRQMHPESDPELAVVDMKDTLTCLQRPFTLSMRMFKELNTKQFIRNKEHPLKRLFYITFMAPWPRIDSLAVEGVPDSCLIVEPSIFRDSLNFWINNQGVVPDTIKVAIKYHKTDDSLGILVPVVEHLKLSPPKPKLTTNKRTGQVEEVVDTLAKFKLTATPENIDQDGIIFDFDLPMIETPFDSVTVTGINPKQQIEKIKFSVKRDTSNIKRYVLRLEKTLEVGYQYTLKVPHKKFRNIDGNYADSLVQKFSLPTNEDLSSITLEISGTEGEPYIFELVDEKRTKIFRTYSVKEDCELTFPYLKAGNYCLRITRDKNGNGLIDTGSVLEKRQPEQVLLFKFANIPGDEAYLLELRERTDLVQTINIPALFK